MPTATVLYFNHAHQQSFIPCPFVVFCASFVHVLPIYRPINGKVANTCGSIMTVYSFLIADRVSCDLSVQVKTLPSLWMVLFY